MTIVKSFAQDMNNCFQGRGALGPGSAPATLTPLLHTASEKALRSCFSSCFIRWTPTGTGSWIRTSGCSRPWISSSSGVLTAPFPCSTDPWRRTPHRDFPAVVLPVSSDWTRARMRQTVFQVGGCQGLEALILYNLACFLQRVW